jgi:signal transduction histidine kinase
VFTGIVAALLVAEGAGSGSTGMRVATVVLLLLTTTPLAFLHVAPLPAYLVMTLATLLLTVLGMRLSGWSAVAGCVALFVIALSASYRTGIIAAAVSGANLIVLFIFSGTLAGVGTKIVMWIAFSGAYLIGIVIKVYRESAAQATQRAALFAADREARAREAVAAERTRLARELHDVVGHALNVVVIQAGAARLVLEKKPQLAREALASIETAGREALQDVERMLGILRAERDEEQSLEARPGLARLPTLVEQVSQAGLRTRLTVRGEPVPLPTSLDLSAYRVVQEALTNALKHAGQAEAAVNIGYEGDALELEVTDTGRGAAALGGAPPAPGHGISGMQERVGVFGGRLEAGPRPEGGFRVWARLPLKEEQS